METLRTEAYKLYRIAVDAESELKEKFHSACYLLNKELKTEIENKTSLIRSSDDNSIVLNNNTSIDFYFEMQCEDYEGICPEIIIRFRDYGTVVRKIRYCLFDNLSNGYEIAEGDSIVKIAFRNVIEIINYKNNNITKEVK